MTRTERRGLWALAALLAARVAAMVLIPLNETTEARYGEMARKMLETGNWVTPMHDYGVPFLAKPPLWAWLSAASMGAFGVNELAARLPALLLSALSLGLVWFVMKRRRGRDAGMGAALILAASGGFFVAAGTVMTDAALVFSVTLILTSFWMAFRYGEKPWQWLFFAGCGIGLLAKGPVALVLAGLPIFFWTLRRGEWRNLWDRLPWVRGSLLTLAIAAPWYVLAEKHTPGFLDYFLIGENVRRFLDPGWKGDQYGYAHAYPWGMIWVFAILCFLPWAAVLSVLGGKIKSAWKDDDGWMLFVALWGLVPLAFFTFAANIIWPYPLPALPGLALLLAELLARLKKPVPPAGVWSTAVAGLIALAIFAIQPQKFDHSEKDMVALWRAQDPARDGKLMFWGYSQIAFSAAFYSGGRATTSDDPAAARALLKNGTRDYLVVTASALDRLPKDVRRRFDEAGRLGNGRGVRILLKEKDFSRQPAVNPHVLE
jgi:4-amino-4-deoxy-L-arabinose transferase-like glycosyltransferase